MPQTYDVILKGGTVVNQDGRVQRDLGSGPAGSSRSAISARPRPARPSTAPACTSCPASSTPRCISASPALTHKEDLETGSRGAVLGGVTARLRDAQHQPARPHARRRSPTRSARPRIACIAISPSMSAARTRTSSDLPALERLPGCAGVKVFMGSSTGSLLVEDDDGVRRDPASDPPPRRLPFRGRVPARRAQAPARRGRSVARHPVWRDAGGGADAATQRLVALARETGKRIHVLHISTAEEMVFLADHKDVATVEVTPHHLTLARPSAYERLGTYAQMNPPVRDAGHRDGIWGGLRAGRRRCARLRPRAAHPRGEGPALSRVAIPA